MAARIVARCSAASRRDRCGKCTDIRRTAAAPLRVARVHARQIAREQRRFVTARAGANFDESVARVVRVLGQQHALQFGVQLVQLGLGSGDFLARQVGHVGVGQHVLRRAQVGLALLIARPAAGHGGDLGVLAREGQELGHVGHDVRAGEEEVQLAQAVGVALELVADEGLHANGEIRDFRRFRREPDRSNRVLRLFAPAIGNDGASGHAVGSTQTRVADGQSPALVGGLRAWVVWHRLQGKRGIGVSSLKADHISL